MFAVLIDQDTNRARWRRRFPWSNDSRFKAPAALFRRLTFSPIERQAGGACSQRSGSPPTLNAPFTLPPHTPFVRPSLRLNGQAGRRSVSQRSDACPLSIQRSPFASILLPFGCLHRGQRVGADGCVVRQPTRFNPSLTIFTQLCVRSAPLTDMAGGRSDAARTAHPLIRPPFSHGAKNWTTNCPSSRMILPTSPTTQQHRGNDERPTVSGRLCPEDAEAI